MNGKPSNHGFRILAQSDRVFRLFPGSVGGFETGVSETCRQTYVFRQARRRATVFEYVRGRKGYGDLNDGEYGAAELRTDLLKLHQLAMAVFNEGARSQVGALFELAGDLNDQVFGLMTSLEQVQKTLSQLTALYPESLSYADPGDTD